MPKFPLATLLFIVACAVSTSFARAQATPADPLYKTVAGLDTAFFDAYNRCDEDKLSDMLAVDLDTFNDSNGLTHGRQRFLDDVKDNACGKLKRELVSGTLEIYPLRRYGALEIGTQRFHHTDLGDHSIPVEAKFVMIWQTTDGAWKLSRIINYGRHYPVSAGESKVDSKPAAK